MIAEPTREDNWLQWLRFADAWKNTCMESILWTVQWRNWLTYTHMEKKPSDPHVVINPRVLVRPICSFLSAFLVDIDETDESVFGPFFRSTIFTVVVFAAFLLSGLVVLSPCYMLLNCTVIPSSVHNHHHMRFTQHLRIPQCTKGAR